MYCNIIHCIWYNNLIWYFVMLKYWETTEKRKPIHDYQGNIYSKTFYLHYRHINEGWNFSSSIKYNFLGGRKCFFYIAEANSPTNIFIQKKINTSHLSYKYNLIFHYELLYDIHGSNRERCKCCFVLRSKTNYHSTFLEYLTLMLLI